MEKIYLSITYITKATVIIDVKSNNKTLDSNKHLILIMYKMVLEINEKDNLQEK